MILCSMPGCQSSAGCQCRERAGIGAWFDQVMKDAAMTAPSSSASEAVAVAWMDDGSTRAGSHDLEFRVVTAKTKSGMPKAAAEAYTTPLYGPSEIERLRAENERLVEERSVQEARAISCEAQVRIADYAGLLAAKTAAEARAASAEAHARIFGDHFKDAAAQRDALAAKLAVMDAALGKVQHWAESRCPCHNEQPNPCPLCGASVENLEACKSAESTLPRDVLDTIRRAREARASAEVG